MKLRRFASLVGYHAKAAMFAAFSPKPPGTARHVGFRGAFESHMVGRPQCVKVSFLLVLALQFQRFPTTLQLAVGFTSTRGSIPCALGAFLDDLQFQPAVSTGIDLSGSHLVAGGHWLLPMRRICTSNC